MKRRICILLVLFITGSSCNQAHDMGSKAVADTSKVSVMQKPAAITTESISEEKRLDALAQKMIVSAGSYAETGTTAKEDRFIREFLKVLSKPGTFKYDFPSLKKYDIKLIISPDNQLKIYSWQSPYSGSMWHTQNILQYMGNDRQIITASFNNLYEQKDNGTGPSPILDKCYKINNAGANQYLLIGYGQMSGTEPYSVAHMLNITSHRFNINRKVFVINNKPDNEIYVSVNVGDDQDIAKIRKRMDIKCDSTSQRIIYPVTKEIGSNLMLTGVTRQIQFQNGIFK